MHFSLPEVCNKNRSRAARSPSVRLVFRACGWLAETRHGRIRLSFGDAKSGVFAVIVLIGAKMVNDREKPAANSNKTALIQSDRQFFAGRRRLFGFAAAFSLLAFLWLAQAVYRGESIFFDEAIRRQIRLFAASWLAQAMIYISFLGSRRFLIGGVIVALIIFIWLKWKRAVVFLLLTMSVEAMLEVSLKLFFKRPRPEPFFPYPPLESYSFPSGHALASLCFYVIIAWFAAKNLKTPRARLLIWSAAATLVLLIGFSRVYLGVHFPSDVLGGFAAAGAWIFTVVLMDCYLDRESPQN